MILLSAKNKLFFLLSFILIYSNLTIAQTNVKELWVDSVFKTLTPDQRIAQLLMVRAYSNRDENYNHELIRLVSELNLGGVCFFQGGPTRQAILTNKLQYYTPTPLFVAIDGEWGLGMRLDSVSSFPKQMTLGAIRNNSYIYEMGAEVARQMKRIGVHINFSPVADVNNNPNNPVINARSFGEDRLRVAEKAYFYMKGMQDNGLIAVGKHFPGHGDTGLDSHYTLPVIDKTYQQIDSVELFPFRYLIDRGIKGIMISHLRVPQLDTTSGSIATLSKPIIQGLLRGNMGFDGMVITDGMDMKGLVDFSDVGLVEAEALIAGNDILLLPVDARIAIHNICNAIESGFLSQEIVDEKCKRILGWKYDAGLSTYQPVSTYGLHEELNRQEARLISTFSNSFAVTMLTNQNSRIPLKQLDTLKIASIAIGDSTITPFQKMLSNYAPITHFNVSKDITPQEADSLKMALQSYNLVIVGFVRSSDLPSKRFNVTARAAAFVDSLANSKKTILTLFANPYSLDFFYNTDAFESILVSYQDNPMMQELTAQILFGGRPVNGILPVSANGHFKVGDGLVSDEVIRVSYAMPEEDFIATAGLNPIDSLVWDAIDQRAFPGAQVVVIRHGKVIYNKAFGTQTYESFTPLKTDDLFDLASLTKVLATTMMAMKLTEEKIIKPDRKFSHYEDRLRKSNKKDFTIREIMAHEARLQSFIPYHLKLKSQFAANYSDLFAGHYSIDFPHRVADAIYLKEDYPEIIIDSIIDSQLLINKGYKYSDLGFILLAKSFEKMVETPMSVYLNDNFYKSLGLPNMGFHPRNRFSITRIAPTEFDTVFRHQLIHGDVHDQTAALLGGVAGNAGLFSNAMDVGIILQMLIQNGQYGGLQYLDSSTIADFTKVQFPGHNNRRGAGFDKPPLKKGDPSPACEQVSPESYGHSGFTGTYFWVDPVEDLVYVFLSNRIYPDAGNTKIVQLNVRTKIHEVIYNAIKNDYIPYPLTTIVPGS